MRRASTHLRRKIGQTVRLSKSVPGQSETSRDPAQLVRLRVISGHRRSAFPAGKDRAGAAIEWARISDPERAPPRPGHSRGAQVVTEKIGHTAERGLGDRLLPRSLRLARGVVNGSAAEPPRKKKHLLTEGGQSGGARVGVSRDCFHDRGETRASLGFKFSFHPRVVKLTQVNSYTHRRASDRGALRSAWLRRGQNPTATITTAVEG